jgi:peptidyl-prolyl cis-trans isomerase C
MVRAHAPSSFTMLRVGAVAVALSALVACTGGAAKPAATVTVTQPSPMPAELLGQALATVNGLPVGSRAYDQVAGRTPPASGADYSPEEKRSLLSQAIDDELLFQDAFRRGLYHDPKLRRLIINQVIRAEVTDRVRTHEFPEDEVRAWYESHKADFVVPAKRHTLRLFLQIRPNRDEAAATAEITRLVRGVRDPSEDFRAVATQHSDGPYKRRGGDLGFVSSEGVAGIPPEVVAKAFAAEVGKITEPFVAGGGVNVLLVEEERPRLERTYEQMRGAVVRQLKDQLYEQLTADFLTQLREAAAIDIDEDALSAYAPAVTPKPGAPIPPPATEGLPATAEEAEREPEQAPKLPNRPLTSEEIEALPDGNTERKMLMEQDEATP